jgi:hypothetical protein
VLRYSIIVRNNSLVFGLNAVRVTRPGHEGSDSKLLIPIHTEHEEFHKKWDNNVKDVQLNDSATLI